MGANALKILKRDAVGRVSYRAEQREAILDEFKRCGPKETAFARTWGHFLGVDGFTVPEPPPSIDPVTGRSYD
jgi:hypothetical protein